MRFQRVLADATAPADFAQLPNRLSTNGGLRAHLRADGGAIGYRADALDLEPIVTVAVVVIEAIVFRAEQAALRHEQVQETVVVVVAPGATNGNANVLQSPTRKDPREGGVALSVRERIYVDIMFHAEDRDQQMDESIRV